MIAAGMKNGEMRRGPPSSSALCSRSMVLNPPMPEAMNTPTRGGDVRRHLQPGIVHRELRGGDRELDEDVHLLDVFLLDELQRIEALDLAGDPRRELRRVELGDRADAARPAQSASQFAWVPMPSGDTRPTPVTTTTRLLSRSGPA